MTVNKFGNYLFIKSQEHRLAAPAPLQTVKEQSFKSVCFFTLKGRYQEGSAFYLLDNDTKSYTLKFGGKIQHVDQSNDSILIVINRENPVNISSLIGHTINKDDVIRIMGDVQHPPLPKNIFIEFVILCPLIQDE